MLLKAVCSRERQKKPSDVTPMGKEFIVAPIGHTTLSGSRNPQSLFTITIPCGWVSKSYRSLPVLMMEMSLCQMMSLSCCTNLGVINWIQHFYFMHPKGTQRDFAELLWSNSLCCTAFWDSLSYIRTLQSAKSDTSHNTNLQIWKSSVCWEISALKHVA